MGGAGAWLRPLILAVSARLNMDLSNINSYEQLQGYLRSFVNWRGDVAPYDFGAVANLLGVLLDNVSAHAQDAEVQELTERLTEGQAATLLRIAAQFQR